MMAAPARRSMSTRCATSVGLLLCLVAAASAQEPQSSPDESSGVGAAELALIERLLEDLAVEDFERCSGGAGIVLNEVCSVGTECDEDVRVSDFIEVYNPSEEPVDLACFAVIARDRVPFVLRGEIGPGEIRAWGEADLGFRISKDGDRVILYRMRVDSEGRPRLVEREFVVISEEHALHFRVPDGGNWETRSARDSELEPLASFAKSNLPAEKKLPASSR